MRTSGSLKNMPALVGRIDQSASSRKAGGESASRTKTIDASPPSVATTCRRSPAATSHPDIASAGGSFPPGTRREIAVSAREVSSRSRPPNVISAAARAPFSKSRAACRKWRRSGTNGGSSMRSGSGAESGLPSKLREIARGAPTAPSQRRVATRPLPPLPGRRASTASASGFGRFTRWRVRPSSTPRASRATASRWCGAGAAPKSTAKVQGGAARRATHSPSKKISTAAVPAGARKFDLPEPHDDPEEERQKGQHGDVGRRGVSRGGVSARAIFAAPAPRCGRSLIPASPRRGCRSRSRLPG